MIKYNLNTFLELYTKAILVLICTFFVYSIYDGKYFPVHEDETIYYNAARLFSEINSLKNAECLYELRSSIGEFNWYGPFYHIIYGTAAKIVGFSNELFVILHFIFFICSLLVIKSIPIDKRDRTVFNAFFLSTYVSYSFVFTFFPEMLHVLLSLIILTTYLKIGESRKRFFLFIALIFICSLIRITLVYWIFSILFINKINISLAIRTALIIVIFSAILVYMKFFTAPAFAIGLNEIHNGTGGISIQSIKNIMFNCVRNTYTIFDVGNSSIVLFLILLAVAVYNIIIEQEFKNILLNGLIVVPVFVLITFVFLYTTSSFFFEKQLAILFPILIYIIVISKKNIGIILFIVIFIFSPITIVKARENVRKRKWAYHEISLKKDDIMSFQQFTEAIQPDKKEINILYVYSEHTLPYNLMSCFLPFEVKGAHLLYTTNVPDKKAPDSVKFQMYGRYKIDYFLSRYPLSLNNIKLVYNNNYIYLYKHE